MFVAGNKNTPNMALEPIAAPWAAPAQLFDMCIDKYNSGEDHNDGLLQRKSNKTVGRLLRE